jgi:hypothetical protein
MCDSSKLRYVTFAIDICITHNIITLKYARMKRTYTFSILLRGGTDFDRAETLGRGLICREFYAKSRHKPKIMEYK